MKKIILNIAALAAVSLMCVSCNDSFLDRNPTHDLNDNSYLKSIITVFTMKPEMTVITVLW